MTKLPAGVPALKGRKHAPRKPRTPTVVAQPRTYRALRRGLNLLANAVRHGNGSVVEVTVARCSPEDAAISVHNAGVIEPEARASLFEAFQQRPDRDKREGLGLGLYIVDQIVHAHGGKVSVESSAQGGTTFQVTLPTSPPAAPA